MARPSAHWNWFLPHRLARYIAVSAAASRASPEPAWGGPGGDADGGADRHLVRTDIEWRGQDVDQALRHQRGGPEIGHARQQHREFIAADTRQGVALPHAGLEPLAHELQG